MMAFLCHYDGAKVHTDRRIFPPYDTCVKHYRLLMYYSFSIIHNYLLMFAIWARFSLYAMKKASQWHSFECAMALIAAILTVSMKDIMQKTTITLGVLKRHQNKKWAFVDLKAGYLTWIVKQYPTIERIATRTEQ